MQNSPDLIICDITMPVLDGFGVLEAIQKDDTAKNIPFIFLTAKSEQRDLQTGIAMGADDYIVKSFNGTDLLNAIDKRLYKRDITE